MLEGLNSQKTTYSLEELALPYALELAKHLKKTDKQGTSGSSKFLDSIKGYNNGSVDRDELIQTTAKLGFNNVLDAFHIVNQDPTPVKFLEKLEGRKGITITDDFLALASNTDHENLYAETEGRWRLVETAWELRLPANLLSVSHDNSKNELFISTENRRIGITSSSSLVFHRCSLLLF